MAALRISEAFGKYGAKLKNVNWSVCALASDGSLVTSLWQHHFEKAKDKAIVCRGKVSRWSGHGNAEFAKYIGEAYRTKQVVRVVIAVTTEVARVEAGEDASKIKKAFHYRPELIGEVVEFDGDNYAIRFPQERAA